MRLKSAISGFILLAAFLPPAARSQYGGPYGGQVGSGAETPGADGPFTAPQASSGNGLRPGQECQTGAGQGRGHDRGDSRQPAGRLWAGRRSARARATARKRCFRAQTLLSALERMEPTVPQTGSNSPATMQVKNMAAVFVVATLPPFRARETSWTLRSPRPVMRGSLEGGILLMTPLYGPDGQIFAEASGPLVLGGYLAAGGRKQQADESPDHARIPGGGLVERPGAASIGNRCIWSHVCLNMTPTFTRPKEWQRPSTGTMAMAARTQIDSRRVEIVVKTRMKIARDSWTAVEGVEVEVYQGRAWW